MESKRLIIGIGQGAWMLNPRMLAMGNQTQIALLMAEYDRYAVSYTHLTRRKSQIKFARYIWPAHTT